MHFRHIIMGALAGFVSISAVQAAEVCTAVADSTGKVLLQRGDCQRQVSPASTFKIAISLMGYDAGFLKDAHTPTLPFRKGYADWRPSWRKATDPASWMSDSVVWYSQQVTQSLGKQRFASYARQFQYGNADVSGDAAHDGLTRSWLDSSLRISPLEQLAFLDKVVNRQLGLSAQAYDMTARLMQLPQPPAGWRVNGKTGTSSAYGWYVGWARKGAHTYVFARLIEADDKGKGTQPAGMQARDSFLKELPQLLEPMEKRAQLKATVDQAIEPLMKQYGVPGMAVAITDHGKHYVFNYGLASRETGLAVNDDTLFEIGSVSKTLAVTLTSYAQAQGKLALTDTVSQHLPSLRGSSFDHVSLINLATHTAGNFPMQVPDAIKSEAQLMDYFKQWQPADPAGTHRTYSNLGIGLLGIVTANSLGTTFAQAMEQQLFPALGMQHSYIKVPPSQMQHYAQGYNGRNQPVRVNPDLLADEAYGVKTTASDLLRFVDANLGQVAVAVPLQQAIKATQTGYFQIGPMTQDLVWEQFPAASKLPGLLTSVDDKIVFANNPATSITPPLPPQQDVLIHKTGSTGGFGAYVLYSPGKKTGIVILANRFYPGAERLTAAYRILEQLEQGDK